MAKTRRTTFGELTSRLRQLGFEVVKMPGHVMFKHPSGRPVVILPAYQPHQVVKPIHQMMVWKQLTDAGVLKGGAGSAKFSVMSRGPAAEKKAKHGEAIKASTE